MKEFINYQKLVDEAMRGIVSSALQIVAKNGLQGDHHFYISFTTQMLGVRIPDKLRELYGDEITIVLQNQFDDLVVEKTKFSVVLSFGGAPEKIVVPFRAITSFSDPSVKFTIEFTNYDSIIEDEEFEIEQPQTTSENEPSNVIALDKFRDKSKK